MAPCPVLDEQTVIELSREGGFAYIPGLRLHQKFALAEMPLGQREHLCALIRQLLPLAQHASNERCPGSGDERYYLIQILRADNRQSPSFFELRVPESSAPPDLARFWKEGRGAAD